MLGVHLLAALYLSSVALCLPSAAPAPTTVLLLAAGSLQVRLYDCVAGKRPQMELSWGEGRITALCMEPDGECHPCSWTSHQFGPPFHFAHSRGLRTGACCSCACLLGIPPATPYTPAPVPPPQAGAAGWAMARVSWRCLIWRPAASLEASRDLRVRKQLLRPAVAWQRVCHHGRSPCATASSREILCSHTRLTLATVPTPLQPSLAALQAPLGP